MTLEKNLRTIIKNLRIIKETNVSYDSFANTLGWDENVKNKSLKEYTSYNVELIGKTIDDLETVYDSLHRTKIEGDEK